MSNVSGLVFSDSRPLLHGVVLALIHIFMHSLCDKKYSCLIPLCDWSLIVATTLYVVVTSAAGMRLHHFCIRYIH